MAAVGTVLDNIFAASLPAWHLLDSNGGSNVAQ